MLSLVDGQPLVTPQINVIFAALYEVTINTPSDASLIPFAYDSLEDISWAPITLNSGEKIRLLALYTCHNETVEITFDYDGTFNYFI